MIYVFYRLLLLPAVIAICPDTVTCIDRLREVVAGPKRFWFGEQRKALCHHRTSNPVDCFGPPQLSSFHSLGGRLFRARTYHAAYLRNLEIFPRITYRAVPGQYRGCEHDFVSNETDAVEADPDMAAVAPFRIRHKPEIGWHGLQFDDEFLLLMTDVGFASLNYLVSGFPRKPVVLKEYEPSDNFRPSANPLVLLVFRKPKMSISLAEGEDFSLPDFMMKFELEDDLIGMNIVVVGSDTFGIERQRLKGNVDNCHSLLPSKIRSSLPSPLLSSLPLSELSQWISVSFKAPRLDVNVCCQRIRQSASSVFLDPLGDLSISALSTLSPPSFTSLRINTATQLNYHRQARTYVALMDELYTLVVMDGQSGRLHWMVVDIPATELATEMEKKGKEKASYLPLSPSDPATCRVYLFVLLEQTHSLIDIDNYCDGPCLERNDFRLDTFKQQYGLKLSALNWMTSCYDLPYAYHVLSKLQNTTNTEFVSRKDSRRPASHSRLATESSSQVCSSFKVSPHHRCPVTSKTSADSFNFKFIFFISISFYMVGH